MKLRINWPAGILSAIAVVIIGLGFFIFVGSRWDFTCKNATVTTSGCRIYNGVNAVISGWADIWRRIFAPRCLGGVGPDDCLGPDGVIMFLTLFVVGFVGGNLIWRRRISSTPPTP